MQSVFSLPVKTLSRAIVFSILFTALMISALSIWTVLRTGNAVSLMGEFEQRADPSATAQNELVQALGYGGMIHAFKNFVLRGDEKYYRIANQNAGAALSSLERLMNLEPELRAELKPIATAVQNYVAALSTVQSQHANGKTPEEIDAAVKIDDGPALVAIALLAQEQVHEFEGELVKSSLLAELRDHLGYGGMIHHLKNLVLRQDTPRIEKARSAATSAQNVIVQLKTFELSINEQQALRDLSSVVEQYASALDQISDLIAKGKTATEIDAEVKVSDSPALDGLRALDAIVALEGRAISAKMTNDLRTSQTLLGLIGGIVVVLSLLTAFGTREVLRRGVVSKQAQADAKAAALQEERDDFQNRIATLAANASAGDFSQRIAHDYSDETLAGAATHLDQLLETIESGLDAVINVSHAMARGDFSQRMEGEFSGAFGRLQLTLNEAMISIAASIQDVLTSSSEISDNTSNISSAASDLAKRTEKQSCNLETSAATLGQLTTAVQEISMKVAEARATAEAATGIAQSGSSVVEEAVSAMDKIVDTSKKISKVTELIEEIAFQTNLLALNAGVEAARAGESGRGFAVVASEVLALAHRASDAVQEINDLISASELEIEDGAGRIAQAGASIKGISGYVSDLDTAIESVAESTQNQASHLDLVNQSVSELKGVTQQNVSMFEETAASIQSLNELTDSLMATGAQFVVTQPAETTYEEPPRKQAS